MKAFLNTAKAQEHVVTSKPKRERSSSPPAGQSSSSQVQEDGPATKRRRGESPSADQPSPTGKKPAVSEAATSSPVQGAESPANLSYQALRSLNLGQAGEYLSAETTAVSRDITSQMYKAASGSDTPSMEKLLEMAAENGEIYRVPFPGLIRNASKAGNSDMVELLLKKNIQYYPRSFRNIDFYDFNGAIIEASVGGHTRIVEQLLPHNTSNDTLKFALENALTRGHQELSELLLDTITKDNFAWVASVLGAAKKGQTQVLEAIFAREISFDMDEEREISILKQAMKYASENQQHGAIRILQDRGDLLGVFLDPRPRT